VLTGDVAAPLSHLPIRALGVFIDEDGAGDGTPGSGGGVREGTPVARARATAARLETLHRWGLGTLGEVAALPADALFERMGSEGLLLQRLARGDDAAPLVPDPGTPRFMHAIELEWPIDALEPLSFVLARLLDPLSEALARADRAAAALRLDLRLVDRTLFQRVLQLPAAMRDPKVLRTLLLLDLESHPPSAGIDIVTVEIDPAPARVIQYSLLERALPSVETLATLTARLSALVGETRCGSPALCDTHRPDGFDMRPFAPESRVRAAARRRVLPPEGGSYRPEGGSYRPEGGSYRPEGGSYPPERGSDVERSADSRVAGPESRIPSPEPRSPGPESRIPTLESRAPRPESRIPTPPCLRRFRPPVAVRVAVERGRPVRVAIDRRGMPGGDVAQQAGPWRTSGAWWDAGAPWDRDEWDVALSDGSLCRLFHDRLIDRWFLDGVFD
jgi:hypothetical protein